MAQTILKKVSTFDRVDRIFSKKLFTTEFEGSLNAQRNLTNSDVDILLTYLRRDKGAILYNGEVRHESLVPLDRFLHGQTIKFITSGETSAVITPEDAAIASLRTLIADQNSQMATLGLRIENLSLTARKAVANKNKVSALSALRSKKLAETMLTRVSNNMTQLEEILNNVRQAADQVEMVRIMEASAGVLKSLHKEVGGIEKVEKLVEELSDEVGKVQEVDNIIKELGQVSPSDDLDIDEELEAMERADEGTAKREDAESMQRLEALSDLDRPSAANTVASPPLQEILEGVHDRSHVSPHSARSASERMLAEAEHPDNKERGEGMTAA